jgi:hypothetical protein
VARLHPLPESWPGRDMRGHDNSKVTVAMLYKWLARVLAEKIFTSRRFSL